MSQVASRTRIRRTSVLKNPSRQIPATSSVPPSITLKHSRSSNSGLPVAANAYNKAGIKRSALGDVSNGNPVQNDKHYSNGHTKKRVRQVAEPKKPVSENVQEAVKVSSSRTKFNSSLSGSRIPRRISSSSAPSSGTKSKDDDVFKKPAPKTVRRSNPSTRSQSSSHSSNIPNFTPSLTSQPSQAAPQSAPAQTQQHSSISIHSAPKSASAPSSALRNRSLPGVVRQSVTSNRPEGVANTSSQQFNVSQSSDLIKVPTPKKQNPLIKSANLTSAPRKQKQSTATVDSKMEQEIQANKNLDVMMRSNQKESQIDEMRRVRRESLMASEYVEDIFAYLRETELKTMPDPNYMVRQKELQWNVRSILVDWIVAVHQKFHLLGETLFLTVNLIDRCLSVTPFGKHEVQLLGISCLFIACKYEEVIAPTVKNMEFMLDGAHNAEDILNAERFILKWLQYDLSYPGPYSFLRRISQVDNFDVEIRTLAKYFLEVLLMDERFLCVPPSAKAATGMYLAKQILQRGSWTPTHVHISGYTEAQLVPVCHALMETISKPAKYSAVYEKYNQAKYMGASQFVSEWYREVYNRQ